MMESPMIHMDFVPATAEDYTELMSISGGIFKGMDYLPYSYHAWLKDHRRKMYVAKIEGKIVGFVSFFLVDGGETAVGQGVRVAPWMRGQGIANIAAGFVWDKLHSDHPQVKRIRLVRAENPPLDVLKKYKVITSRVGFVSFFLVDGGETAVGQGVRVAPWMRGQGIANIAAGFVWDKLHSDHPQVKRIRLVRAENPPLDVLKKYKVITSRAVVSMILPSGRLEEAIRLLEARLNKKGQLNNYTILEPAEVLKLFERTKTAEDLLPGGLLIQGSLPITTHRSNLEMLFESKITWIYSQAQNASSSAEQQQTDHDNKMNRGSPSLPPSSVGFLSLGTPAYPVPYADTTYRFDIDMFGTDPASAKLHVVQQLKLCIQSLAAGSSIFCNMFAEESLRAELSQLQGGLIPFILTKEQIVLQMDM